MHEFRSGRFFKIAGSVRKRFLPLSSPPPYFSFSRSPYFSLETLATQAKVRLAGISQRSGQSSFKAGFSGEGTGVSPTKNTLMSHVRVSLNLIMTAKLSAKFLS